MYRYFNRIGTNDNISPLKSKGLSDEIIKPTITSDNSLVSVLSGMGVTKQE